jgi:uncharacterized secreted protein with C-terminal beta-propeller domain
LLLPTLLAAACDSGGDKDPPWTAQTTVQLVQYQACSDLERDIKGRALDELDAIIESYREWWTGGGDGAAPPAVPGSGEDSADGGGRQEGTDYSGTNNQEEGVDEADLVKTDGYHIYLVNGNRLHVFDVPEFGQLLPAAELELEGFPYELLLDSDGGRAAVFSMVTAESLPAEHPLHDVLVRDEDGGEGLPYRVPSLSKISVFDVSGDGAPRLEREVWIEGWYQTARRTDHSVRLVADSYLVVPGLDDLWTLFSEVGEDSDLDEVRDRAAARIAAARLDDIIPHLYERLPDGELRTLSLAGPSCRSFYRPTDSAGRSTTSILSFDLQAPELSVDADTVVSNWATVYASEDRLYLAEAAWDWWWANSRVEPGQVFVPSTNIHAFDVTRAGRASYVGSGRIEGTLFDPFSMDEQDGLLRVAATTSPWVSWGLDDGVATEAADAQEPPRPESHIYVLEEQSGRLRTVGHLGGIAPDESIFAARFLPDEAFLITYEQVDPLFTIDLSSPRAPRLVGQLEMPGFSTYLHPIADDRLLAIGVGGDENGVDWNTQVSMFDVSDRAHPAMVDSERLSADGWYSWSEAQYEHKAFQYFAPKKLLAVPMSGYTYGDLDGVYDWHSRLELLGVDPESGITRRGSIDHSPFFGPSDGWWGSADVRRSIFMGDFIYAISARAVTVHRLDDLSEVAAEELPIPSPPYWWW